LLHDLDEWWVERRLVARKLLDSGDVRTAYRVAREAVPPERDTYRVEHEFTAGWIALRFLKDAAAALPHFARIAQTTTNPISLARAGYWQGRAAEALGRHGEARAHYRAAAEFPTAYYGQLAGARLGMREISLRPPPESPAAERAALRNLDIVRAIELLYAIDERDLVVAMVSDLADRAIESEVLAVLAEICRRHQDARALVHLGKYGLGRGLPLDHYAFPDIGVPRFTAIGPQIDLSLVYAIVRQESAFHPQAVSSARALGLMQVTPGTGRAAARRFGVAFDAKRLLSDPAYNAQIGAAELGDLLRDYGGSYILAFVGYNAGRGRVREWIARYGDPRHPDVDPVDWVERIPFSETRNYVQRVIENMQVYRLRLGGGTRLMIEADLRRGARGN
jgi:soluble lytic murein transglycosylase